MLFAQNTSSLQRQKDKHPSFLTTINIKHFYIMKKILITFISLVALLTSCTPSKESPPKADQAEVDSVQSQEAFGNTGDIEIKRAKI